MKFGILRRKKELFGFVSSIDRNNQEVLRFSIGSHGRKAYKKLVNQLEKYSLGKYVTDECKIYRSLSER